MAKLIVKAEYLESEITYQSNGRPYKAILKEASQEQLQRLYEMENPLTGKKEFAHIFESEKPGKEQK